MPLISYSHGLKQPLIAGYRVCHAASGPPPQLVPGPCTVNCVHLDGPPRQTMAAMPMVHFPQVVPHWPSRKPAHGGDKSWLATPFDNNIIHGHLLQYIAGRK